MSVKIASVADGSFAQRAGLRAGETLTAINGHEIFDILDFRFYETERHLVVDVLGRDGKPHSVRITKGEYQAIGLEFDSYLMDKQRSCANKCVFCFIDQLPRGLRDTLYFKDDDERLSFLFGNYITLTNLTERELDRIVQMHISPVNVSVHTTDPELRVRMMKNPHASEIMPRLKRLAEGGVKINCQLVLCPGWNDGEALKRSLNDLCALAPQVQSIALVPVGLTKHRDGLEQLRLFTPEEAAEVIDTAEWYAEHCREAFGRLVWAADEFYITAGRPLPDADYYEGYPQLENGVGLIASLRDEFYSALRLEDGDEQPHGAAMVTGVSAAPFIRELAEAAKEKFPNADWRVYPIRNDLFGETVTVAGLVCGGDIAKQMAGKEIPGNRILYPKVMLRRDGDMFLDSSTPEELGEKLGAEVQAVANDGFELLDAMLGRR